MTILIYLALSAILPLDFRTITDYLYFMQKTSQQIEAEISELETQISNLKKEKEVVIEVGDFVLVEAKSGAYRYVVKVRQVWGDQIYGKSIDLQYPEDFWGGGFTFENNTFKKLDFDK